ncbi:MAG TPA: FecR domain-containing protein [Kofleriaceae bacterium]|nr:FecR domain-containing protein [Kofleriaceae bacterium]
MKLAGRIVVEPLDEERLIKIERRVVAGAVDAAQGGSRASVLREPRRYAAGALAITAVVAAGFIGWTLRGAPASAPVVAEPSPIEVRASRAGEPRTVLDIGDARIESDPDTDFAVRRPAGGVLIVMTRGKLALEVAKRGGRPPLVVRAGDTDVIVVGTRFSVDFGDGQGGAVVRVTEGAVRVVHQQQETRVAAGQAWQTRTGLIARAEPAPGGEPTTAAAAAPAAPAAPAGTSDATTIRGRDGGAIALGPAPDVLHDRRSAVPDAPRPGAAAPTRAPSGSRPVAVQAPRPRAPDRASDPVIDLRSQIRAQHIEPALDLGEPSAAAAVARYYEIAAHRSGEEASQAFYSIAVVRYLRLGRPSEALQALDAYVRRFPGGKEYRAVLWLRVRILCLDKLDDRCRAAAYTYLQEAPNDPAARVAELLTMTR